MPRSSPEATMLDLLGILFSSIIMMLVIARAVKLDRTQAWFQTLKRRPLDSIPPAQRR